MELMDIYSKEHVVKVYSDAIEHHWYTGKGATLKGDKFVITSPSRNAYLGDGVTSEDAWKDAARRSIFYRVTEVA
jgi:hypothetical protein